ncbi:acyl-CoA dehydrogenase family protein [Saprospiraceae bacterium]|jgi:acyl-CoA dehydrogenase|nr:acyl-CoA dehydrogenase family protein [Saprospiraceae bacterium]
MKFTEEHELFRQSLRAFLDKEVQPNLDKWEEDRRIPREVWKKMGNMGFLGIGFPESYGGSNLDFSYDIVFNEELGRINSGGFIITQQVVQYMSGPYILKYGSKELKQKYLPGIISGDLISCIGITEPGAGSDAQNIQTRAVRDGDHYIVNGSKTFITNGVYGDFIVTVVKTNPDAGAAGVSLLVIDRNAEGVSARKLKKLGWHASDTAELSFDNVKVPVENLIGQEGRGFQYLMNGLQLERLCFIPCTVVACETAIEKALQYMSEREAFGQTLDKFQVLRHRIAQLASEVEALKAFSYYCCQLYGAGIYDVKLCSMAKLISTELQEKVSTQCLQFYGGYGFMEEYPMARMYRDCRVGTIGGGSSEIMREIISKIVIDSMNYEKAKSGFARTGEGNTNLSYFTKDHEIFRQSLRDFMAKEVLPHIDKWEKEGTIPREIYQKFGKMGYFGLAIPEEYGGSSVDRWYEVVLHEELARVNSGGFAAAMGAHFFLAMTHVNGEGNHEQKMKYLVPGCKGTLIGCMAVTEPFGGSDVQAIRTTAVREGNHYIINGSKTFITNGVYSDYIVAACQTNPSAKGAKGISMILIPRDTSGVSSNKLDKLGWHASDTGEIAFDNVKVPVENLLGEENYGFMYIMQHFVSERLSMAVGAVATSEYALEVTLKYMNERMAFGQKINKFQVLRHRIAQMASEIEKNKQFVYSLYQRFQDGDYLVKEASMAKLVCTQLADKVTFECLQMFGGYGYMEDYPLARMWRDARLGQIGGGTSEILCEIISKAMIDGKGYQEPMVKQEKTIA